MEESAPVKEIQPSHERKELSFFQEMLLDLKYLLGFKKD